MPSDFDKSARAIRVAQIAGAISIISDPANGFAEEKGLRTTVLAVRLARACGLGDEKVREVFWAAALRFVGCSAFAHETAKEVAAGDDNGFRGALQFAIGGEPLDFLRGLAGGFAPDAAKLSKVAAVARLLTDPDGHRRHALARCEAAVFFARDFGMAEGVLAALDATGERPDGRGPLKKHGDDLPLVARIADVADLAEVHIWHGGLEAARPVLRKRAGRGLDAEVVATFQAHAGSLIEGLSAGSSWSAFLDSEPPPVAVVDGQDKLERFFVALGRFADVKSVFTLGHSARVTALARHAAEAANLPADQRTTLIHAAATHDLGRVAVSTGVWEKPGPFNPVEWRRVQSHTEQTDAALRIAGFEDVATLASSAHERGPGSGYHRRLLLDTLTPAAKLLAAADVAAALGEDRPHRPAFDDAGVQKSLRSMVTDGLLDAKAVQAVLEARGVRAAPLKQTWPRGLTDREVEVVRLVAIGRTNKEIGSVLGMSWRTAQKHVTHVYEKVGRETRTGLALFAIEHGLLDLGH